MRKSRVDDTISKFDGSHLIGTTQLFCRLITVKTGCLTKIMKKFHCQSHLFLNRPDEQSDIISVQQDALPGLRRERGCKRSNASAFVNKLIRTSIANIKSMGQRGSPWRCPCWFLITSLGSTLSSTRVEDVASRFKTRLRQTCPKSK